MRRTAGWALTVLAFLLVWFALVAPDRLDRLTPAAFVRIPIEGLLVVAVCLLLPTRARRIVAAAVGALLGVLAVIKIVDMGFFAELDRPFNPASDWGSFGPAAGVLRDSIGPGWARAAVIGAIVVAVAVPVLVTLAMLRLTGISARHRLVAARTVGVLGVAWALCAVTGVQVVSGAPIASTSAAGLAYDQVRDVSDALHDRHAFASRLAAPDPVRKTPTSQLLAGLRGKDVIVAFVESYGRVAVQDSAFSPQVDAVLDSGTRDLEAAGFSSRSAFLTSPTFGGYSWLAHSTLQSGMWINSQQRYDQLVGSDRFTLSDAFGRAGWRTVGDVPSNTEDWPQGHSFYHYDAVYDANDVGYAGPRFSYAAMPDQYTLAAFQRMELTPGHAPVMAEIDLVSSHTPWTPLPHLVPWDQIGDGSIYDDMPTQGPTPDELWRNTDNVRASYGRSIEYSVESLVSFVQQLHDDNLVLVLLGDHQPSTTVSGHNASRDVPVTIVAHDPAVLARISSWGWDDGMRPDPSAPVWPMSAFRNRFLTAFGGAAH